MAEPAILRDVQAADVREADDFASLMRQHQAMVFSLALHFLRDRQAAEEIAQDVFLHLHRNLAALMSAEHITFWLRKVTSHRCIDYARRRKLAQVSLADVPELRADGPRLCRREDGAVPAGGRGRIRGLPSTTRAKTPLIVPIVSTRGGRLTRAGDQFGVGRKGI